MPAFRTVGRLADDDVRAGLVRCDGRDPPRAHTETVNGHRVWIIVAGRFAWRDRRRRAVADPGTALLLTEGEPFEIRHPHGGGDTCLAIGGAVAARVLERRAPGPTPLSLRAAARWIDLAARLRMGEIEPLELEEALYVTLDDVRVRSASRRDRAVAESIVYELHLHIDEPTPLTALARAAGVSVFHACRVFRRVHGTSIHQHRKALRLRHALALLRDTSWPLARVALECGYANQAHMTNQFRAGMGTTPGALRGDRRC